MRILIVDDDCSLAQLLARALAGEGVEAEIAHTAADGLTAFRARGADLLVIDLELDRPAPGQEAGEAVGVLAQLNRGGAGLLEAIRREAPLCPVLILSASADTETRVACLDLGADDCLRKPFSLSELRARTRAMLRRRQQLRALLDASAAGSMLLSTGELVLDRLSRTARLSGMPLVLTVREFALLEQLLLAGGSVMSRAELRSAAGATAGEANTVDVHMVSLRRKLAVSPLAPAIETVRGLGYRLETGFNPATGTGGMSRSFHALNSLNHAQQGEARSSRWNQF